MILICNLNPRQILLSRIFFELLINDCKRCNINTVEYFSSHFGQKNFSVFFFFLNVLICFNTNHEPWSSVTPLFACLFDLFNVGVNRIEYTIAKYISVFSKLYLWKFRFQGVMGLYTHVFRTICGSVYWQVVFD